MNKWNENKQKSKYKKKKNKQNKQNQFQKECAAVQKKYSNYTQ